MLFRRLEIELTLKDCKNILLWYELCFKRKNKPSQADINTLTKIKAFAISEKEDRERDKRIMQGKTEEDE